MNLIKKLHIGYSITVTLVLVVSLLFFIVYPICKVGKTDYMYYMSKINPKVAVYQSKQLAQRYQQLSDDWVMNFERVASVEMPSGYWEEDTFSSKGVESFYLRDQYAEDTRNLLLPSYDLPCDKDAKLKAMLGKKYFYAPEHSPEAKYHVENTSVGGGNSLTFQTGSDLDTWIYLPAKQKQPSVYALDFDFLTNTSHKETIQLDFMMSTLADRFRFMVKENKTLKFDIWSSGYSLGYTSEEWKKFEKPFSLPLSQKVHVRLEVINDTYQISFDGKPEMTIKAKNYPKEPSYWCLIFWNGIEEQQDIKISISNFRILHHIIHGIK